MQIAKGSLGETATRVRHGYARGYLTLDEFNELMLLCRRTRAVLTALIVSLDRGSDPVGGGGTSSTKKRQGRG